MSLDTGSTAGAVAFNIGTSKKLDLSEELAEIIRTDNTALLSRIGAGGLMATQETHSWVDDRLNPNTATLVEDLTTIETAIDITSAHYTRFKVGTLFKFNDGTKEVCQVITTPITGGSGGLPEVTRNYGDSVGNGENGGAGGTTGEVHSSGATIMIISHNKQEGWKPTQEDWTQERPKYSNYLTGMGYGITISTRRQAVSHAGIASEFAHQSAYRLREYMRQLDSAIINSVRSPTEGSSTVYSSMGGLIQFIGTISGPTANNLTTTSEALTPSVVNSLVKLIWDKGGMVAGGRLALICGGVQKRKISAFDQAFRRMDFNSSSAGYVVEKFVSDLGFEIEVIVDPWCPDDTIIVGDLNRLRVGPLQTMAVAMHDVAKTGETIEAYIYGEYTCEIRNFTEAWAMHSGLTS